MDEEIALWPTTRQAAAIRSGEISSRALLELLIERIERLNPALNAVITKDYSTAREAADAADAAVARGDQLGPLHGVPITIKDALETEGIRSTGGATELKEHVPTRDAPVVRAVKEAGAIVFGKTNLPRWSGDLQSFNELFGTALLPLAVVIYQAINFHHYIVDGMIWKMRKRPIHQTLGVEGQRAGA